MLNSIICHRWWHITTFCPLMYLILDHVSTITGFGSIFVRNPTFFDIIIWINSQSRDKTFQRGKLERAFSINEWDKWTFELNFFKANVVTIDQTPSYLGGSKRTLPQRKFGSPTIPALAKDYLHRQIQKPKKNQKTIKMTYHLIFEWFRPLISIW